MTFSIGDLTFKDSFQFMAAGLGNLVEALISKGDDNFEHFHNMENILRNQKGNLYVRKGFILTSGLMITKSLNKKDYRQEKLFYSKLKLSGISKEEYKHAQNVYKTFNCKTFQDYHDLYLKSDVLLLADIFENFRTSSIAHYRLDPANVITAASYAWSAMLLKTCI